MQKILIFILFGILSFNMLSAETIEVKYKVEFGIFGEIGIANAKLTKEENSYEIDINLDSTGIAKTLSGDRKEQHISKGHMENGTMVSDLYQIIKSHGSKTSNKVYRIDHQTKQVTVTTKKWKNGKQYKDKTIVLDHYAKDDLLTLYFNLDNYIEDKTLSKDYRLKAVGAEKQDGFVDLHIPDSSELPEFKEMLGEDASWWYARAIIHQDIFSSDNGELLLCIGTDGITEKAVLKDLIFFGDIRAFRL